MRLNSYGYIWYLHLKKSYCITSKGSVHEEESYIGNILFTEMYIHEYGSMNI